jgi:stearoyl-CoA desaturase (delta-9 desaturase)
MALVGYLTAVAGVIAGFHRRVTHGSFKARRPLRIALAVAGSLASIRGSDWCARGRNSYMTLFIHGRG